MYTKAAAWASSALFLPIWNAVGFRMVLKQSVKQIWYLISVTAMVEPSGSSSEFVEQSDTNSDESKLSNRNRTFRARHNQQNTQSQKEHTVNGGKKGNSSRKHYSDHHLELFKATVADFESSGDGVPSVELLPTQLGAVQGQPSEKDRLFNALSRKGRLQEAAVAEAVGKSELEVRGYLMFLRNREAERHLFEKQTKQVSHADIPAAIEISQECETALEQAADALAIFQNQYVSDFSGGGRRC
jgi:hypothetical protein